MDHWRYSGSVTGGCLLGGGSRIVKVTSTLVPIMGVAYILISIVVLIINHAYLPMVFTKILRKRSISMQFLEHSQAQL